MKIKEEDKKPKKKWHEKKAELITKEKKEGYEKLIKINNQFIKNYLQSIPNLESLIPKIDYSKIFPKIDYSNLIPDYSFMFKDIFSGLSKLNIKAAKKFKKEFPWLGFLKIGFAFELGEVLDKEGRAKVFSKLNDMLTGDDFEKYLKEKLDKIEFMKKRKKIILSGYKFHKNKDYLASTSILIPQVEGIIWEFGVYKKIISSEKEGDKRAIGCSGNIIKIRGKEVEWDLLSLIDHLFDNSDPKGDHLREYFYSPIRTPVSHGRKIDYDTLENSTTALLMLYGLIEKINEIIENESKD